MIGFWRRSFSHFFADVRTKIFIAIQGLGSVAVLAALIAMPTTLQSMLAYINLCLAWALSIYNETRSALAKAGVLGLGESVAALGLGFVVMVTIASLLLYGLGRALCQLLPPAWRHNIVALFFVFLVAIFATAASYLGFYETGSWAIFYGLALPAVAGVVILGGGRNVGSRGALVLLLGTTLFSAITAWTAFLFTTSGHTATHLTNSLWIEAGTANYWIQKNQSWSLSVDLLTLTMWCLVTFVALLVIFFSFNYMLHDPHLVRFLAYLGLFTFFMLLLVCSDSLVQFFFAWEGVGICSYLLIGFWSTRLQAVKAALKAVLVNKIGDVFLLFALSLLWTYFGVWRFSQQELGLFEQVELSDCLGQWGVQFSSPTPAVVTMAALCFVLAAVGKSAQLGLHTWLPDAMEGPTPVSALIHAATMVTAGIFLMLRVYDLLSLAPTILIVVATVGALTAISAGLIACYQVDLKKIIAYSTCSQLGYMFFACGLTLYSAGLFHLVSHGFFKALLFLSAGAFIHLTKDEQLVLKVAFPESRRLTQLYSLALYVGLTALSALPFFSGFYSKEPILLSSGLYFFERLWVSEALGYHVGTLAGVLTALYSSILLSRLMHLNPTRRRSNSTHLLAPASTKLALGCLLAMSIFFGYCFESVLMLLLNDHFKATSWAVHYTHQPASSSQLVGFFEASPALPIIWEVLPLLGVVIIALTPLALASNLEGKNLKVYTHYKQKGWLANMPLRANWLIFHHIGLVLSNKFWADYIYNSVVVKVLQIAYRHAFKGMDKGFLEFWLSHASVRHATVSASNIGRLHQNVIVEGFLLMTVFLIANVLFF